MATRPKQAEPRPQPRLYLVTPPVADAEAFAVRLAAALPAGDVAAVLLRLEDADERTLINRIKQIAPLVQQHDAALLVEGHVSVVARAGADGAHLTNIADFSEALDALRPDRIAGCGGLETRHDAMVAAEQGADYVMFGEPDSQGHRPAFAAIEERVSWWAEVFEAPCVGFAGAPEEVAPLVAAGADFVALGDWVWQQSDAARAITQAQQQLNLPETTG